MEKHLSFVWFAVGCLALAACGPASTQQPPDTSGTQIPSPTSGVASTTDPSCETTADVSGERYRAWVLFQVADPDLAVTQFGQDPDKDGKTLLTEGCNDYVIVRADVVEGGQGFNLVVPIDAANQDALAIAVGLLKDVVGEPIAILHVVLHFPTPPHKSHTFITSGELDGYFLKEYSPPGRHPQSPGANPWG